MITLEALPESLYLKLLQHVGTLLDSVEDDSEDPMLASAQALARAKLNAIKVAITHAIDELRRNAEHKTFTIAFYGETNAGKSTLIETLRILLKESSKQAQRALFIALQQQSGLNEETLQALEAEISTCREQYELVLSDISQSTARHDDRQQRHLLQEASLVAQIGHIRTRANFFLRLINLLRKLPEEKALRQLQTSTAVLCSQREAELGQLHQLSEKLKKKLAAECQRHATVLDTQHLLKVYEDGSIIGDGRADFTRQTQTYEFEFNGQAFKLLDVPGIEGDESKVSEQINNAVKRAHAVFYVTAKAAPPQTGDNGRLGTLEKIKAQLSDQTEVWAVYNKRITNPLALQKPALVSSDEQAGLGGLDRIMAEQLGGHYQGSITLSALPAFYAIATCLVPRSTAVSGRKKFLDAIAPDVLLKKTGVQKFYQHLTQGLVTDVQAKIRRANLNKVQQAFNNVCSGVKALQTDNFAPLAAKLDEEAQGAKHQLAMAFRGLNARVLDAGEQSIDIFEAAVRERIYGCIENDISNDQLRTVLEKSLLEESATLQHQLPAELDKQVARFQADVSDIIERFEAHAIELLEGYSQVSKTRVTGEFDLKIDIDNGISIWGLLGGLAGAAVMIWNPVAWPLMVLGGAGIIISLAKAIWSFFDTDFKKGQQRKAAEENLEKACKAIREEFSKTLSQALPAIQGTIVQIEHALEQPAVQARHINQKLDVAYLGLKKMARDLTANGNE
ncbi:TPA: dynamin family protein [Citrobacter freundii]|nr:dynamin family protein [Citrobacter freundii]